MRDPSIYSAWLMVLGRLPLLLITRCGGGEGGPVGGADASDDASSSSDDAPAPDDAANLIDATGAGGTGAGLVDAAGDAPTIVGKTPCDFGCGPGPAPVCPEFDKPTRWPGTHSAEIPRG
jgi:hypothetical protein